MNTKELKRLIQIAKTGGASLDEARLIIETIVRNNGSPPVEQALAELEAIFKETREVALSKLINDFIVTQREINVTHLDKEFGIVTERDRTNRRQILHRLTDAGVLRKTKRSNIYEVVERDIPEIDYEGADIGNTVEVELPFGIHNWVTLYPKNTIILAGSSDAGKTAFMLNVAMLNQSHPLGVVLFNSEMGAEELKKRLSYFDPEKPKFKAYERDREFAGVIFPNKINIIDYLELTTEFYKVADEIKNIVAQLKKGIAFIAIQKKPGLELGYGGETSLWKARLYMTMDYDKKSKTHSLTIKKAKNPKVEGIHPKEWSWGFRLHQGVHFEVFSEPPEIVEDNNE